MERRELARLIGAVQRGESRTLVIRGEPGIGKSALLDYLVGEASRCRVLRAAGVQGEAELAFAGLHQLCLPLLDRLDRIPEPQRHALGTAFGLRSGPAPDRFLVALAVLSLLADAAGERPLVCVIDDSQWLDHASVQALAFVARRLVAESVALVFARRDLDDDQSLAGLPTLVLEGLSPEDGRELLDAAIPGPLDEQIRDRIVVETRGNPLALLELPQDLTYAELAGGFGVLDTNALASRIEDRFRRRLAPLSPELHRLLLVAAVEPVGDPSIVHRAAQHMGIAADTVPPAQVAGLLQFSDRVTFRHPLVRSAIYRGAPLQERREVHRALAAVTDPAIDADRRAWHLARAASGPDESVAGELERSAGRARMRGGLAAAAAFLERAAVLTPEPARRAERALAAANAKFQAGAFDAAQSLLALAADGPLSELDQAKVGLLRAHLAFVSRRGGDAPLLLLQAAQRLEPVQADLARATYLDALSAAMFAGRLARPGGDIRAVARAAGAAAEAVHAPRAPDLLLAGLAANFNEGYPAAAGRLRSALAAFGRDMSADEELRWLWLANEAALHLWDDERWLALSDRYVRLARTAGALSELPLALSTRAYALLFAGDLQGASSLVNEGQAVTEATQSNLAPYGAMAIAALSGRRSEASTLIETALMDAPGTGEGIGMAVAHWANAVLRNGFGDYAEATAAAQQALHHQEYPDVRYPGVANWAAAELIEAAAHSGATEIAHEAFDWIAAMTSASRTSWALGLEARSRALISSPDSAEPHFHRAIDLLTRTRVRTELARTHLLYGEWLRRRRRRLDAREQLRIARDMLTTMGLGAFAERARLELTATGEKARRRTVSTKTQLTAREAQIARLAREGLSNPQISTRLFLSPRTIEYHLGNVFTKLGISSRYELDRVQIG